jgi:WD40 repeat protein
MISTQFCPVCGAANEHAHTHCFACGQLLSTGMEGREVPHETLLHERYRLGPTLGSGGFSAVYRARDLQTGREVAIKQVTLRGLSAEETIEATDTFNRELSLLSALRHPQVPRVYDHFNDREHWYLVLEYLEGTTLETYLKTRAAQGKPLQVDEALAMALQLCTVLEYLHTRQPPVIFRDLKPGNIIRSPGGTLCLIDFGIARHFRPGQARDTQALGSPGYAAPEQYGRAQTTPQTDIYSLGALLHALLSGQDPAEQPQGLAPLRLGYSAVETELAALAQRMLSPYPGERPASVREVATALEAIRKQRMTQDAARIWRPPTLQASPSSMASQQQLQIQLPAQPGNTTFPALGRRTSRRRVLIGLGALAVGVAGCSISRGNIPFSLSPLIYSFSGHTRPVNGVAWSPGGKRIASASWDHTVQVWDATNGRNVFTYRGHSDGVTAVAWSPNGRQVASASSDRTIQVWDAANGGNVFTYRGHSAPVNAVAWSPNGRQIASASSDHTVQVWDATTGENILTYRGHSDGVTAVAWSPDSKRIASASPDHTVQVWDATTGENILTYRGHSNGVAAVAWSPEGGRIVSGSWDDTVQVWDATTGEHILTYRGHTDNVAAVAWSPDGRRIASGSFDGTVQVWDATTGKNILTYHEHSAGVTAVAWSPDGRQIASASFDDTVQVLDAP